MGSVIKMKKKSKAANGRILTGDMTKEELFIHYLDIRMKKLEIALKNVANLANTRTYSYTDIQKTKILSKIKKMHDSMRSEWTKAKKKRDKKEKTFSEEQGWL